jgi:hypothetical protein
LSLLLLSPLLDDSLVFLLGGPEVSESSCDGCDFDCDADRCPDCILSKSFRMSFGAAFGAAKRNAINPIARAKVRPESVAKSQQHATSTVMLDAPIGLRLAIDINTRHAAPPVIAQPAAPAAR